MHKYADKTQENKSQSVAGAASHYVSSNTSAIQLADNRPETLVQRKLQGLITNYTKPSLKPVQKKGIISDTNTPIQLYQPVNLGGELDEASYERRAIIEGRGSNAFGSDNLARAVIILATGEQVSLFAFSQFGVAHSEEKLIEEIKAKYGAEVLSRDPATPDQTRIKEFYTERAPCDAETAEHARKGRQGTDGNCHAHLSRLIHHNVPVLYSVANSSVQHGQLMRKAADRYVNEVVNDTRRISYQNAINRGMGYFAAIRTASFKKYGSYGRDYISEARKTKEYIDRFRATVNAFQLDVDYLTPLTDAFVSVPHFAGGHESELVMEKINQAAAVVQQSIDHAIGPMLMDDPEPLAQQQAAPQVARPHRFRPSSVALAGIRSYTGKAHAVMDPAKREQLRKAQELARKIRGDRF